MTGARASIRIAGMGLSCALGESVGACTAALEAGEVNTECVTLDELLEPLSVSYYRIPDAADLFDAERLDRILLRSVREAVDQAGLTAAELERTPLFIGSSCYALGRSENEYRRVLDRGEVPGPRLPGVGIQTLAMALERGLGCHGETYSFNTACTSAANGLLVATRMLQAGILDRALVIGVELANHTTLAGFAGLQLLADHARPFDRRRSGIVLGEGIGAVVLVRGEGPVGIQLLAGANNGDSYSVTAANPDGSTIAAAQRSAMKLAGVDAKQVRGIKSHGTASPMNDTGEAAGILRVFDPPPPVCALKPYIGHTLGACGVNELILMAGALERGFFPGTPGFEEADPQLKLAPERRATDGPAGDYLLNFFGFGGNNTCLVVRKP